MSDAIAARSPGNPSRLWDGRPLAGRRVVLRALHGFGDALQMIRYAPLLRAESASLCVECAPELVPLLRACDGVEELITWAPPPARPPEWDAQVEIMELPWICRAFPSHDAYLDPAKLPRSAETIGLVARMRSRRAKRPQVGLAWRSSDWNPRRSLPLATLTQALPGGCDVYSLQQNGGPELAAFPAIENVEANFADLAVRMAALDVVLTVDGVLAHLAGALGKPALLLLPFVADWRWGLLAATPWYPRTRLFRQRAPGDWVSPIAEARAHLKAAYGA